MCLVSLIVFKSYFYMTGVESEEVSDAPVSPMEIEPTVVSGESTIFCMLPDWVLLLFSIPTDTALLNEPSTDVSSHGTGSESPMTVRSTDSLELKTSPTSGKLIPVQRVSSKSSSLHLAGSSVPLITQAQANQQPSSSTPYCYSAPASSFHLRIGPDYNTKRRKAPSGEAFMDLVGME